MVKTPVFTQHDHIKVVADKYPLAHRHDDVPYHYHVRSGLSFEIYEPSDHTVQWALLQAKEGHPVRRREWIEKLCMKIVGDITVFWYGDTRIEHFTLGVGDLLARDWELF